MSLVVPAILGGLALAVMALVSIANARARSLRLRRGAGAQVRILVHSINDDRCTGCDACVAVCPTNVLDLVENKSRVLRFQDCIQCEACMWACPTTALVMHPEGTEPPKLRQPDLDQFYQTAIPGQYLIGEVAGKPLVKNAANLGRGVVEHMLATGLRPLGHHGGGMVDVAIVGSGPGGMSAALTCIQRGLSYMIYEKDTLVASTVARYPKGKLIMAEPYDSANLSFLPVFDSSKEEMVPIWRDMMERAGVQIKMNEAVESVVRGPDGNFDIRTNVGTGRAQRVVLATGLRGKPRTLGVPGENLPKVQALLEDPDNHRGQTVCVVGGGDSALEAAIALADAGAKVVLTYRGRSFARAQPKNKQAVESYEAQRRIKVKYQSEVVDIGPDTITLKMNDGTQKRYPNEAAFVLIGADPPIEWLATLGIHFVERAHLAALPKSDDLVRQFVPDAMACPDTAAAAVALLMGQPIAEQPQPQQPQRPMVVAESRSKKWLRSATNMFQAEGKKLERPMPLSEFAKQARRHSGQGRRDKLDPRERTRVLRMLRDEGGRRADEDSKLYLLERATRVAEEVRRADEARRAEGSPPPAAPSRLPPPFPNEPQARQPYDSGYDNGYNGYGGHDGYDPMATLPPSGAPRPAVLGRPTHARHGTDSPKPAVIVGLARASQTGPAIKRRRDDSRQIAMMEPTRQMAGEDARRMLERMEAERREREVSEAREAERRLREPRLPMGPGPGRGPSRHQQQLEDGPTELAPLHLEDEDTHDVGLRQARSLVAEARPHQQDARRDNAFEEPTRAVDWGTMDDLARGSPPGGRRPPGPPPGLRSERAPRGEPPLARPGPGTTRGPDEDTRSVDLKRVVSLSEI
ncbi:MAG TPA: NAD(P)-binding domain-containing protein, partial [Kofleriaceae bacterium]|nr:NAD(P)-binding domain-containing protein [Kofleriaceae bacterium]